MKELAEDVLGRLMAYDVAGQIGAGRYERNEERTTQRNGYRHRAFDTRLGTLDLKIPKPRKGSYFPGFLEPRRTTEQASVAVIQEAWIQGVSTRKVDDLVQAMGMSGISKSQVSELCKGIDVRVNSFLERPIKGEWTYLSLDATYLKVREDGRIVSCGHHRYRREHRRPARDPGARSRPVGGGDLLARVPARLGEAGAEGRQARHLGRARRLEGRHRPGVRSDVAALPCPFHAQYFGLCAEGSASDGGRRH